MWCLSYGMSNQTSEAFAYIEREYNDVKGASKFSAAL
jgi:hypothetical protein